MAVLTTIRITTQLHLFPTFITFLCQILITNTHKTGSNFPQLHHHPHTCCTTSTPPSPSTAKKVPEVVATTKGEPEETTFQRQLLPSPPLSNTMQCDSRTIKCNSKFKTKTQPPTFARDVTKSHSTYSSNRSLLREGTTRNIKWYP